MKFSMPIFYLHAKVVCDILSSGHSRCFRSDIRTHVRLKLLILPNRNTYVRKSVHVFQSTIKDPRPKTKSPNSLVDPMGLKPAPHGLKVRCSVTRAPGQCIFDFLFL